MEGRWVLIEQGQVPLRCWWNNPQKESKNIVLVLPEVFGINNWVKSVVDRFAEHGIPALAMPLFARTAPELNLGYSDIELEEDINNYDEDLYDELVDNVTKS